MASFSEHGISGTPAALGLDGALEAGGLNVAAALSRERYDALVPAAWHGSVLLPTASTIFVLGSGGPTFYAAARRAKPDVRHPLDEFCEALVTRAASRLEQAGFAARAIFYWERRGEGGPNSGQFADFVALARAAGLGAPSRLGLLLHPTYGPWFSIRALILCACPVPDRAETPARFDPCAACPAPCIEACPGDAVSRDPFSAERCASTREELPQCAQRCAARLACPEGAAHRYDLEALAYHMTSRFRGADDSSISRGAKPRPS